MSKTYLLVAVVPSAKNVNCLPAKFSLCLRYTIVNRDKRNRADNASDIAKGKGDGKHPGDSNIRRTALLYEYSYAYPSLM